MMTDQTETLLDGIRDEVREAVLEGDAQDCSSADCIADAVYEIVRVRLRDLATPEPDAADPIETFSHPYRAPVVIDGHRYTHTSDCEWPA